MIEAMFEAGDIIGAALAQKADAIHYHLKNDISDFDHTHTKSEITDFDHTHEVNEITDFPDLYTKTETDSLLSSKSDTTHTHTVNEITDFPDDVANTEYIDNAVSGLMVLISGLVTRIEDLENRP
jgi:hypothetical protein